MYRKWPAVALAVGLMLTTVAATTAHEPAGQEPVARAGVGAGSLLLPLSGKLRVTFVGYCPERPEAMGGTAEYTATITGLYVSPDDPDGEIVTVDLDDPEATGDFDFNPGPYLFDFSTEDETCMWALFVDPW